MKKRYDIAKGERLIEEAHAKMAAASGLSQRCTELSVEITSEARDLERRCTAGAFDFAALLEAPPAQQKQVNFDGDKARAIVAKRARLANLAAQRDKLRAEASHAYELAMKIKTFLETPGVR